MVYLLETIKNHERLTKRKILVNSQTYYLIIPFGINNEYYIPEIKYYFLKNENYFAHIYILKLTKVLKDPLNSTLKSIKNDEMLIRCQALRQIGYIHDITSFFQQTFDGIITLILGVMKQKTRQWSELFKVWTTPSYLFLHESCVIRGSSQWVFIRAEFSFY